MASHRTEIAVVMKQWSAVYDAPGTNQEVDGFANGNPSPAQISKIAGCGDGNGIAPHSDDRKPAQQRLDLFRRAFAIKALQHLAKHQIPHDDLLCAEYRIE